MILNDKFAEDNLPLVHSLCKRFVGKGIDYDDLFQSGALGLIKAINGYDESRGNMFSTYAVPVILGEIKRLFRDDGYIKVSRSIKELALKINKYKSAEEQNLGREITVGEIAEHFNISKEEVSEAICVLIPAVSLTQENDDNKELDLPVFDDEEKICNKITVYNMLEKLDDYEKKIIRLRYYSGLTQNETATILNITQVQVSRIEKKILLKLRKTAV